MVYLVYYNANVRSHAFELEGLSCPRPYTPAPAPAPAPPVLGARGMAPRGPCERRWIAAAVAFAALLPLATGWTAAVPPPSLPVGHLKRDVLVVGGGLAGLSVALELAQRGRQVTVLSRDESEAASRAAGGMIAPQAERLESGPYLDLCLSSRSMYSEWVQRLESLASIRPSDSAAAPSKPDTGFWSSGGFLSPAFEGDEVHRWTPPPEAGRAEWLSAKQVLEMEPLISENIVGGWWYPQDMNVDARRLLSTLKAATQTAGVEILEGVSARGMVLGKSGGEVEVVPLSDGRQVHVTSVVAAAGAWMRDILPIPMSPQKGQMLSLQVPRSEWGRLAVSARGAPLTRVLFCDGVYIIPKRDGRIVVGATVENGVWDMHNTPEGISELIGALTKVCPALGRFAIEEMWAGLRPLAPDAAPVLGASVRCANVFAAGGYWRNGVLLAPKTAQLVADAVMGTLSPTDAAVMQIFSPDRFKEGSGDSQLKPQAQSTISSSSPVTPSFSPVPPSSVTVLESLESDENELARFEALEEEAAVQGKMFDMIQGVSQSFSSASPDRETESEPALDEYSRSELFAESKLKEAREANRNLGSLFSPLEGFDDEDEHEQEQIPLELASSESAPAVAAMIGAEIVDVPMPEGVTVDEVARNYLPFASVTWQRSDGLGEVSVPYGTNIYTMASEGKLDLPGVKRSPPASAQTSAAGKGVVGEQSVRKPEVQALYDKVIKNKARVELELAAQAPVPEQKNGSWIGGLGNLFRRGSGSSSRSAHEVMAHSHSTSSEREAAFDAYDFIRADKGNDALDDAARNSNRLLDEDDDMAGFEAIAKEFEGQQQPKMAQINGHHATKSQPL
jgi:glycine oxidase